MGGTFSCQNSRALRSQQSEVYENTICDKLQRIKQFMINRQNYQVAERFDAYLYSRGILTFEQLVKVVKNGGFPEFKQQYYQLMSQPQQYQFDDQYQKLIIEEYEDIKFTRYKYVPENQRAEKEFYILVIGITGNGKTTFIDSLCNALTQNSNDYLRSEKRYYLVDEQEQQKTGKSITKDINKYAIYTNCKNKNYKINLIDTPGLNDTEGANQDLTVIDKLGIYLQKEVPYLDLILLVSKEQERYTFQEELSMQSIVKLLGVDTPKYTKQILTFSELSRNIYEDKFNGSILNYFYEKQVEPKYHQFQNSLMLLKGQVSFLDTLRFQKNLNNYKKFLGFNFFNKPNNEHLDLTLTQKVIDFRKQIKAFLHQLGNDLKLLVLRLMANKNNQISLMDYENQIQKSCNFTYRKLVVERKVDECEPGFTTTFCNICDKTCHDRCEITNERAGCIVFRNKKCFSGDCGHEIAAHEQKQFVISHEIKEKVFEYKELKDQFNQALTLKQQIEKEISDLNVEQASLREQICVVLASVKLRDQELRKTALFHDIRSEADEFYLNEINRQYVGQTNFIQELEKVGQLYKSREQEYQQKAQKSLEKMESNQAYQIDQMGKMEQEQTE